MVSWSPSDYYLTRRCNAYGSVVPGPSLRMSQKHYFRLIAVKIDVPSTISNVHPPSLRMPRKQSSSSFHHTTCLSNFRFLLFRHAECLSCYSDVQNGLEVPVTDFKFPTNGNRWVPHLSIKPHTVLKHSFHSSHIFGTLKCRLVVWMADLCIYLFCVFI